MDNIIEGVKEVAESYEKIKTIAGLVKDIPCISGPFNGLKYAKGYFLGFKKNSEIIVDQFKKNGKDIRVSFSYLILIEIDEKLLLVRSNHHNKFQPIGGVYKVSEHYMGHIKDLSKPHWIFNCPEDDWRIIANSVESYQTLLELYKSGKGVKDSLYREFCEEMIDTGILCKELFSKEEVLDRLESLRAYSDVEVGCDVNTLYNYDVYKLSLSKNQKEWVRSNLSKNIVKDKYVWVERSQICNYSGKDALVPISNDMNDKVNIQLARHTIHLF